MLKFIRNFLNLNFYTSELDDFLYDFNKHQGQLTKSQQQEANKYEMIYHKRDHVVKTTEKSTTLWDNF